MNDSLFAAGQPVTYQRYTNNGFVPARVLGPSTRGEQYIHIVYERNGHEQEHHAPLERVSFPIPSPSLSDGAPSPPLSAPKAAPKPAPKGKHVQLFKMKRKVGKGFYSVPVNQNESD